ncbi:hypothetical protein COO60DRAFT_1530230 [Scenedesmus sp. NREL 46B-D3]|nr:hypothetical protein COO60DRAFT_1530230 [Scenedesmus sp. NREL 46B-D3]
MLPAALPASVQNLVRPADWPAIHYCLSPVDFDTDHMIAELGTLYVGLWHCVTVAVPAVAVRPAAAVPLCLFARAAADKLYTKSRTLNQGAIVLMTAAQAMLAEHDEEGYREKKAAAEQLRAESRAAFDEAQRLSWSANNKAQQTWQVDLHGLGTSVALRKFVSQFSGLEAMASGHPGGVLYQVITGKGKHSEDNVPKIKLGVMQYLMERGEAVMEETGRPWGVSWQVDPCNEGVVNVYIPGCSEEEAEPADSSA